MRNLATIEVARHLVCGGRATGSTLIACEKAGRRARLVELDPKYVDTIVLRWQAFSGGRGPGREWPELHAQGIDLYLDRQGVDTTTPGGKALFQMMGVFAEFEREIIRERVCAGLEKARAKGKRLGRPMVPRSVERSIRTARAAGKGQLAIARELGVGVSTVRRVLGVGHGA
jgi:hypothetical protein